MVPVPIKNVFPLQFSLYLKTCTFFVRLERRVFCSKNNICINIYRSYWINFPFIERTFNLHKMKELNVMTTFTIFYVHQVNLTLCYQNDCFFIQDITKSNSGEDSLLNFVPFKLLAYILGNRLKYIF
jgi:hypothetical protein